MQWALVRVSDTVDEVWREAVPFYTISYIPVPWLVDEEGNGFSFGVSRDMLLIDESLALQLIADIYAAGSEVPDVLFNRTNLRTSPEEAAVLQQVADVYAAGGDLSYVETRRHGRRMDRAKAN